MLAGCSPAAEHRRPGWRCARSGAELPSCGWGAWLPASVGGEGVVELGWHAGVGCYRRRVRALGAAGDTEQPS